MTTKNVAIKQDENEPIPAEIIAASIVRIADGFERIKKSGLTQRAILLLISHASETSQTNVKKVLDGIESLRTLYVVQKPKR